MTETRSGTLRNGYAQSETKQRFAKGVSVTDRPDALNEKPVRQYGVYDTRHVTSEGVPVSLVDALFAIAEAVDRLTAALPRRPPSIAGEPQ